MFFVAGYEGEIIFRGRSRDDGVTGPEMGGKGIFLHINGGSVADIFREGKDDKIAGRKEILDGFMLVFIPGALKKLHIGLNG